MVDSAPFRFPPPLQPGDRLCAIAPSGALNEIARLQDGLALWQARGYRVDLGPHWDSRYSYLAGDDAQRREALRQAWENPDYQGVLCIRGGYGSARLLEEWQWPKGHKWLIGFSDITGLLWSLARRRLGAVHGPVLTSVGKEPDWSVQRLIDCVEGRPLGPLQGEGWGNGVAIGTLLPANLAVATNLLFTPAQPDLEGVILAWEDVTEAPYRLDRMITQWRLSGALQGVRGIALGQFTDCAGNPGTWPVLEMLRDRLADLNIPIVANLPFGHVSGNAALPVGVRVELDSDRGSLIILD
jgi:muramoyltetrapeptide carboxypeptidase